MSTRNSQQPQSNKTQQPVVVNNGAMVADEIKLHDESPNAHKTWRDAVKQAFVHVNKRFEEAKAVIVTEASRMYDNTIDMTGTVAQRIQKFGDVMNGRNDVEYATVIKQHFDLFENVRKNKPELYTQVLLVAQKYEESNPVYHSSILKTGFSNLAPVLKEHVVVPVKK